MFNVDDRSSNVLRGQTDTIETGIMLALSELGVGDHGSIRRMDDSPDYAMVYVYDEYQNFDEAGDLDAFGVNTGARIFPKKEIFIWPASKILTMSDLVEAV